VKQHVFVLVETLGEIQDARIRQEKIKFETKLPRKKGSQQK
jgi:hypothetical protein